MLGKRGQASQALEFEKKGPTFEGRETLAGRRKKKSAQSGEAYAHEGEGKGSKAIERKRGTRNLSTKGGVTSGVKNSPHLRKENNRKEMKKERGGPEKIRMTINQEEFQGQNSHFGGLTYSSETRKTLLEGRKNA